MHLPPRCSVVFGLPQRGFLALYPSHPSQASLTSQCWGQGSRSRLDLESDGGGEVGTETLTKHMRVASKRTAVPAAKQRAPE